jgi:hypothetical protein
MHKTYTKGVVYYPTMIDEVTTTTTSSGQLIAGATGVGINFLSANETVGETPTMDRAGTMTVEVSVDNGTTWIAYNMLIDNATNTNAQNFTRVASKQISSAVASHLYWMTPETLPGLTHFRVKLTRNTEGTGGTFTIKAVVTY